jgi:pimeloyl-ACP methyl ester carboxylesterase
MKPSRRTLLYLAVSAAAMSAALQPALSDGRVRQLLGEWKLAHATSGQTNLRVFTAGDGPTIVLLPGRGLGPSSLEPLARRLVAAGFRVVLPEPRGYGESVGPFAGVTLRDLAADVARSIEVAGGAPVVVAGHAYGNRIARMLAQERADLIRGVVVMAAGGKFPPTAEVAENLRTWLNTSLPENRRAAAAKAAFFGPQSNPANEDLMLDGISADTSNMQAAATGPLESWWPGGGGPMLVIQGLSDVVAPPENGRSLKADYSERVTLKEFSGLGHFMIRERPDLIAQAIIAFMQKLGR